MKQGRQGESSTVAVFVGKNSWSKSQVVDLSLVVAVSPNVKGNKKQAHVLDHRLNRTGAHDVLVKLWCLVAWAYWTFNIFWWWVTHSCSSGRDIGICFSAHSGVRSFVFLPYETTKTDSCGLKRCHTKRNSPLPTRFFQGRASHQRVILTSATGQIMAIPGNLVTGHLGAFGGVIVVLTPRWK